MLSYDKQLHMIYQISPCLPAGRLTPLCPPGQRPYGPEAKEGERKAKYDPYDYVKSLKI